jgi:hypothetical protein
VDRFAVEEPATSLPLYIPAVEKAEPGGVRFPQAIEGPFTETDMGNRLYGAPVPIGLILSGFIADPIGEFIS